MSSISTIAVFQNFLFFFSVTMTTETLPLVLATFNKTIWQLCSLDRRNVFSCTLNYSNLSELNNNGLWFMVYGKIFMCSKET